MVIAYKILLLFIIFITFIFSLDGRHASKDMARNATAVCIAAIISFVVTLVFL